MEKIIEFLFGVGMAELTLPQILTQLVGFGPAVASLIASQCKKLTTILPWNALSNLLLAVTYTLAGGFSGAGICYTAVIQTMISYFYARKKKEVPLWQTFVFLAIYLLIAVFTYKGPSDIIPAVASITYALAVVQSKPLGYRIFLSVNSALWVIYDIVVMAYTMVLTHGLLLVSLLIAIVRYDIKKRPENVEVEK